MYNVQNTFIIHILFLMVKKNVFDSFALNFKTQNILWKDPLSVQVYGKCEKGV